VYVREPNGARFLLIDQTTQPKADAVVDWQQQEAARQDDIRDYRRIRIVPVDYYLEAADWEFTHTGTSGTPLRQPPLLRRLRVHLPAPGVLISGPAVRWAGRSG
jgi:hypothetical protein